MMYSFLLLCGMFIGGEYTPSHLDTIQVCCCGPECKCPNCITLEKGKIKDKLKERKEKREQRKKERQDKRNKNSA